MTDRIITQAAPNLAEQFPEWVKPDARQGYQGYLVDSPHLVEVMRALRDQYGYDYLSSVTGVDYYPEDLMEVVYH